MAVGGLATRTRKEVARRADVSVATVSAVLNKNRYVSPELTERVQRIVDELGYRPNAIARSLSNQSTLTVALIIPNILSPFWPIVVKAAEDRAALAGYRILLQNTNEDAQQERRTLELLDERQVDGAVLAPVGGDANHAYLRQLLDRGVKIVLFDRSVESLPLDTVVVDNHAATCQATQHLIEHGRRRIGFIGLPPTISCAAERLGGYQRALRMAGLFESLDIVQVGGYDEEWGYASMQRLLASVPDLDGMVVGAHLLTIGALRALADAGVRVPDQIAMIGFDDFPWTPCLNPPLTVVAQPQAEMGRAAMDLLLRRMNSVEAFPPDRRELCCCLILRRSCGCEFPRDRLVNPGGDQE